MESPAVRAKPETPDVVQATETGAEPTDLDSAANRCVSYPNSWVSWCELSSEREVRLGCRRSRVAILFPREELDPGEGRRNGGVHRAFDAAFAHRIASLWRFRALFNPPRFTARSEPHRDRGKRHTHRVLSRFFFSRRGGTTSTSGAVEQASTTPVGAPTSPEAAVSKVSEVSAVVNATEGEFMS